MSFFLSFTVAKQGQQQQQQISNAGW